MAAGFAHPVAHTKTKAISVQMSVFIFSTLFREIDRTGNLLKPPAHSVGAARGEHGAARVEVDSGGSVGEFIVVLEFDGLADALRSAPETVPIGP